ncbi:MAG TPA: rhodanese-like domain-containing protein [Steroidobacteraceae bacterium]|nr:rhodanese-like domain-containing protein [Steroidobacteraceae bacterium]
MSAVPEVSPRDLASRLHAADPPVVLDVREPWEQDVARLAGTLDIPMGEVSGRLAELPKDRDIVVMCRSGGRSSKVADYLHRMGYRAANLTGGILAWAHDVDPTLPTY